MSSPAQRNVTSSVPSHGTPVVTSAASSSMGPTSRPTSHHGKFWKFIDNVKTNIIESFDYTHTHSINSLFVSHILVKLIQVVLALFATDLSAIFGFYLRFRLDKHCKM